MESVKSGNLSIEKRLFEIFKEEVLVMREEVISLILRVIYVNFNLRLKSIEDVFDIVVK